MGHIEIVLSDKLPREGARAREWPAVTQARGRTSDQAQQACRCPPCKLDPVRRRHNGTVMKTCGWLERRLDAILNLDHDADRVAHSEVVLRRKILQRFHQTTLNSVRKMTKKPPHSKYLHVTRLGSLDGRINETLKRFSDVQRYVLRRYLRGRLACGKRTQWP